MILPFIEVFHIFVFRLSKLSAAILFYVGNGLHFSTYNKSAIGNSVTMELSLKFVSRLYINNHSSLDEDPDQSVWGPVYNLVLTLPRI